ncbi:serine hydrolase domain-containing protein [Nocardia cyriacigeorgica]|uniref:serine hydrolase domain-containing protein n=1 Tax=Nocardia cyriacigeorgica TaxID=135487 RepID=UPI001894B905|nr:serine hydrolase domain-containing protein [Nocardia cyriacigeorgica]MBF6415042.1 beta-lactamase family protein [Nocardia cyriacigeorgica]
MRIDGFVADGLERVWQVFDEGAEQLGRGGGALSVYVDGEAVVDIWGGQAAPGLPWQADTTSCLMSATKGLTSTCALVLYDRGLLDLDAPVAAYWPEFAAAGKAGITVGQLLSNRSGLPAIPGYEELFGAHSLGTGPLGFDRHDEIHCRLAAAEPMVAPGTPAYGIFTFGYLVGALVSRVSGRSLADFFGEEVAGPLGLELWMGRATAEVADRAARIIAPDPLPPDAAPEVVAMLDGMRIRATDPGTLEGKAWLAGTGTSLFDPDNYIGALVGTPEVMASGGGFGEALGTARGVARLYSMLAEGGRIDGKNVVSKDSIAPFATVQTRDVDAVAASVFPWTIGFHGNMDALGIDGSGGKQYGPSDSAFGKDGLGGQIAFADPENRVAVGFVRNHHVMVPDLSPGPVMGAGLSRKLIDAVYASLGLSPGDRRQ